VNGKPIVTEQVFAVYRMSKEMLLRRGRMLNEEDDKALRVQSLEVVIAEELLYQAALANRVTVSDAELEAGVKQIRARAGSEEAYKKFLAESKLSEADVKREVGRNIHPRPTASLVGTGVSETRRRSSTRRTCRRMFDVPNRCTQYILVANEKDPSP
jgi:hypothetical protein